MNRISIAVLLACICLSLLTGCSIINKIIAKNNDSGFSAGRQEEYPDDPPEEYSYYMADGSAEIERATMEPSEIVELAVSGYTLYESERFLDFDFIMPDEGERTVSFYYDGNPILENAPLSDEQVETVRALAADYNLEVADNVNSYWPHSEEYPPMLVIFDYKAVGKDKYYHQDGAMSQPVCFEEFMEKLEKIATEDCDEIEGNRAIIDASTEQFVSFLTEEYVFPTPCMVENEYKLWRGDKARVDDDVWRYSAYAKQDTFADLQSTYLSIVWPDEKEDPCPYTPYDINCYAYEYTVKEQPYLNSRQYLAVCVENIRTKSGLLAIYTVGDDNILYHCFGMPYSADDTCTLYDNGGICAHLGKSWTSSGDYYFMMCSDVGAADAKESDVTKGNVVMTVDDALNK